MLEPGTYDLWAQHQFPSGQMSRKKRVIITDACTFVPDVKLEF